MPKKFLKFSLPFIFIVVVFGIFNHQITQRLTPDETVEDVAKEIVEPTFEPEEKLIQPGRMTKTLFLSPDRKSYTAWFFNDDQKIAECKIFDHVVSQCTRPIPNGKIEFKNRSRKTHGTVEYWGGQRDGIFREYYDNGQLKTEANYILGDIRSSKQYFSDGILRMEQDFSDALVLVDDPEVGAGKVYRRDGTLMYEWRLTNKHQGGYKRSYDRDGRLVFESYFDQTGKMIRSQSYDPL